MDSFWFVVSDWKNQPNKENTEMVRQSYIQNTDSRNSEEHLLIPKSSIWPQMWVPPVPCTRSNMWNKAVSSLDMLSIGLSEWILKSVVIIKNVKSVETDRISEKSLIKLGQYFGGWFTISILRAFHYGTLGVQQIKWHLFAFQTTLNRTAGASLFLHCKNYSN